MQADRYIKQRVDQSIGWYERSSLFNRFGYYGAQACSIFCAALIPFLSGLSGKGGADYAVVIGVLGVVIAVATATSSVCRFNEMWIKHRTTCEALKREKFLFETGVSPYDHSPAAAETTLVQRIEAILSQENAHWAQIMAKPGAKDGGP